MAGHLLKAGHPVVVWNRTPAKAQPLQEAGAEVAASLEDLGRTADIVFLCVTATADVQACAEAVAKTAKPGTLFVDHSTIAPEGSKAIGADLVSKGMRFVDAPITGGSMGAQKGQLTVFCGGSEEDVKEALQYIAAYAKRAERVGGPGYGQLMKLANQIAVGGALLGLCETLSFAKKAGLDLNLTLNMIGGGAGGSWAFQNYGPKVLAEDWTPGFSIANQRKDFGYCRDAAKAIDAAIPGTDLVDNLLKPLQDEGHGDWTTAALYEILVRMNG